MAFTTFAQISVFCTVFPLLSQGDETVALQLTTRQQQEQQQSPLDVLCGCHECPSMAAAKNFLVKRCIKDMQDEQQVAMCTQGAEAAFAGYALGTTFDTAICPALQDIFGRLGESFLGSNASRAITELEHLWRRPFANEGMPSHYSADSNGGSESAHFGTVIINHGDNNTVSVSGDHQADTIYSDNGNNFETGARNKVAGSVGSENVVPVGSGNGNMIPIGSGNIIPIGSGNVIPIGSGNVIPIGSGNVIPIGSGNVIPIGSGNFVIVPVGSGNSVLVPVGSGNSVSVPVGSDNAVVVLPVADNTSVIIQRVGDNVIISGNASVP